MALGCSHVYARKAVRSGNLDMHQPVAVASASSAVRERTHVSNHVNTNSAQLHVNTNSAPTGFLFVKGVVHPQLPKQNRGLPPGMHTDSTNGNTACCMLYAVDGGNQVLVLTYRYVRVLLQQVVKNCILPVVDCLVDRRLPAAGPAVDGGVVSIAQPLDDVSISFTDGL